MIYPYWEELRDTEPRFLPLIPITVRGPADSAELIALVDSGAEHSVFSADLAEELGVSLSAADHVTIVGVGENQVPGWLAPIELRLGRHRWQAPAIFIKGNTRRCILGQIGFFAFFHVTFRYDRREMGIRWVHRA